MTLKDKIVLITGSAGGIGKATALKFAQEKAKLILVYHQSSSLTSLEEELKKASATFSSIQADLTNLEDIKKLFSTVKAQYAHIDILLNIAGIEPASSDPLNTKEWKQVFNINLFAPVECTREAVGLMQKGSVVVNISSVAGKTGTTYDFGATSYAVSKAALSKFTEVCAHQFAPKIRFVAIEPGYIKTPLWGELNDEKEHEYSKNVPIGRFTRPDEVADLIVAVCKNESINGHSITIDGGLSLKYLL